MEQHSRAVHDVQRSGSTENLPDLASHELQVNQLSLRKVVNKIYILVRHEHYVKVKNLILMAIKGYMTI